MKQRGFSLIELLIVVAIMLVIAAIAIPNLIRSRIQANEASAISSIRAVNTAQVAYVTTYPTVGYADNLAKLGSDKSGTATSAHADLLDWVLGCATQPCPKSGYSFQIVDATGDPVLTYGVTATPITQGSTGIRGFCSNNMNPVMYDPNGGTDCQYNLK